MSFSQERRNEIRHYMMEKIYEDADLPAVTLVQKTVSAFHLSDKTAYRYLKEMQDDGLLDKKGRSYRLLGTAHVSSVSMEDARREEEDRLYMRLIHPYLKELPENVRQIWDYACTEMLNNAIDHSEASSIRISVTHNPLSTEVCIADDGVGIFQKIREYGHYASLDDAVCELFKGKLTTDPSHHSGEGIFFTSRLMDSFAALSDGKVFTFDKLSISGKYLNELSSSKALLSDTGSVICMRLSNYSNKVAAEIFDQFADVDSGFTRTRIPLKNIYDTYPVSRSQAKRLCRRLDEFREIELDFDMVYQMGQGFAHELFVIFRTAHPQSRLIPINVNETVRKMLRHVGFQN